MAGGAAPQTHPPLFDLIAGDVSLDFINTLDDRPLENPTELLNNYADLARFGEQAGILTRAQKDALFDRATRDPKAAEKTLVRARGLRESLYVIFSALMNGKAAPQDAMETLNHHLHQAASHSQLIQTKAGCQWRFDDLASSFDGVLWPISRAAAELLTSDQVAMVRGCSSPTCQWFFLDTSKNHRRRWCDMSKCGNRAKVRNFYARKRSAG